MRSNFLAVSDAGPHQDLAFDNKETSTSRSRSHSLPGDSVNSQSRARVLRGKLNELEERIEALQKQLDAEMRIVQNIAVLTPFQRSTRERLQSTANQLAKTVRQLRIEITKNKCYRDVLMHDYLAERGERMTRKLAEVIHLDEQRSDLDDVLLQPAMKRTGESDSLLPPQESRDDASSKKAPSSVCDSFHSALDLTEGMPEGSSVDETYNSPGEPPSSTTDLKTHSIQPLMNVETKSTSLSHNAGTIQSSFTSRDQVPATISSQDGNQASLNGDIEVAEQWDKTRAAKRVSLVKIPPGVRAFNPSQKHVIGAIPPSRIIPEDESGI